jgi:hypothetical protein
VIPVVRQLKNDPNDSFKRSSSFFLITFKNLFLTPYILLDFWSLCNLNLWRTSLSFESFDFILIVDILVNDCILLSLILLTTIYSFTLSVLSLNLQLWKKDDRNKVSVLNVLRQILSFFWFPYNLFFLKMFNVYCIFAVV